MRTRIAVVARARTRVTRRTRVMGRMLASTLGAREETTTTMLVIPTRKIAPRD